jgi:5'-nucleotidase / UDP-sugar diphosphatase
MMRNKGKALGFLGALGALALVLALSVPGLCQANGAKILTILHTNDTHSAMLPFGFPALPGPFAWLKGVPGAGWGPGATSAGRAAAVRETGGIARMATLIKNLRASNRNVLSLHAGDVFVGSFEFNKYLGYPELKIMESLYDAMTLGNHEFDLGVDTLAGIVSGQIAGGPPVTLPLLCANMKLDDTFLAGIVQKSIIKEVGGVKVGIFGLTTEDEQNYSAEMIARFSGDPYTVAGTQAYMLRMYGCEVVVCLSHMGKMADLMGLADNVPGIDIIVGGHSHDLFDEAIERNGKIVVQAGSHGRFLGQLRISLMPGGGVSLVDWRIHAVDSDVKPDPALQARLNVLRAGIVQDPRFGPVYSRLVALAGKDIDKDWPATGPNRDTPLGNLVTDAMKWAVEKAGFQVDCALDALGYVAYGIPAGKVVGNDVLRAVPYGYDPATGLGFKLVVVPMSGMLILGGLEYSTAYVEYTKDLSIQASGLTYAYDSSQPPGGLGGLSRLVPMSVMIGGEYVAANPDKPYMVVMSEQVFNFLQSLVTPLGLELMSFPTGIFEYNAVRDYMRSLKHVVYESEGRVQDIR